MTFAPEYNLCTFIPTTYRYNGMHMEDRHSQEKRHRQKAMHTERNRNRDRRKTEAERETYTKTETERVETREIGLTGIQR